MKPFCSSETQAIDEYASTHKGNLVDDLGFCLASTLIFLKICVHFFDG
jgi:hypothetical protein